MEKEFKIGDTVKIIGNNNHSHTPIGTIGQIHSFQFSNSKRIRITVNGEFVTTVAPWINFGDYEHYIEEVVTDIIIEEEFKLPENWCILRTKDNYKIINNWFNKKTGEKPHMSNTYIGFRINNKKHYWSSFSPDLRPIITFEQFKQYVLKEKPKVKALPFFKILKTSKMGTIIQVQNNEGNIFALGDNIRSITGNIKDPETMKILSFRYNNAKDNICAVTERLSEYGIGIDKIEHVIEFSKNEVKEEPVIITSSLKDMLTLQNKGVKNVISIQPKKEETLLEKAKRLYPVGTYFETLGLYDKQKRECVVECEIFQNPDYGNYITRSSKLCCAQAVISKDGSKMAKILYNGYKIGDIIQVFLAIRKNGYYHSILEKVAITKLETINGEEVAFFGEDNPHNRILIKNIKK